MTSPVIKRDLQPFNPHTEGNTKRKHSFFENSKLPGNQPGFCKGAVPAPRTNQVTTQVDKGEIGDAILEPSGNLLIPFPMTLSSVGMGAASRHTTRSWRLSQCAVTPGTRTSDVPQVITFPPGLLTISIAESQLHFLCPENHLQSNPNVPYLHSVSLFLSLPKT